MMQQLFYVAIGGALGSALRFIMAYNAAEYKIFNVAAGTILVNLSGSFLIGLLFPIITKNVSTELLRFFLISGVLGGYTTFSAFSLENMQLLKTGNYTAIVLNIVVQSLAGIFLAWCGYALAEKCFV